MHANIAFAVDLKGARKSDIVFMSLGSIPRAARTKLIADVLGILEE